MPLLRENDGFQPAVGVIDVLPEGGVLVTFLLLRQIPRQKQFKEGRNNFWLTVAGCKPSGQGSRKLEATDHVAPPESESRKPGELCVWFEVFFLFSPGPQARGW